MCILSVLMRVVKVVGEVFMIPNTAYQNQQPAFNHLSTRFAECLLRPKKLEFRRSMVLGVGVFLPWVVNVLAFTVSFGYGSYLVENEDLPPGNVFPVSGSCIFSSPAHRLAHKAKTLKKQQQQQQKTREREEQSINKPDMHHREKMGRGGEGGGGGGAHIPAFASMTGVFTPTTGFLQRHIHHRIRAADLPQSGRHHRSL